MSANNTKPSYYEILGISKNATLEEIKKQYRMLALKFHPDTMKSSLADIMMKKINEAYETLSDPGKRRDYDLLTNSATSNEYTKTYETVDDKKETVENEADEKKSRFSKFAKKMGPKIFSYTMAFARFLNKFQAQMAESSSNYAAQESYKETVSQRRWKSRYEDEDDQEFEEPRRPSRKTRQRPRYDEDDEDDYDIDDYEPQVQRRQRSRSGHKKRKQRERDEEFEPYDMEGFFRKWF